MSSRSCSPPSSTGIPDEPIRDSDWDLDDLMERSTEVTGTEAPELEQIRRVTGKSIAIVALIAFLAYGLISALANVGIQSLWDELKSAEHGLAAHRAAPRADLPDPAGLLDDRRVAPRHAVRPRPDAAVRGPVHPARRAQLGRPRGARGAVLPAQRGRHGRRALDRLDRQPERVRHPDRR